jgi:hypothetical protein
MLGLVSVRILTKYIKVSELRGCRNITQLEEGCRMARHILHLKTMGSELDQRLNLCCELAFPSSGIYTASVLMGIITSVKSTALL